MKMRIKTSQIKNGNYFFLERFIVCLAGLKETLVLGGGVSGSEIYYLCFKNATRIFFVLLCFSRTRRSGVHLSCMSPSESEEKRGLLKQHVLPSTWLLPAAHIISHHNSGLLLQIQQSAWPGRREHSDRYQTRDGWHTTRTLTASPFSLFYMSAWIPYKMQSQWCMLQVAEDCTSGWDMHLFACLARWQSLNSFDKNPVWLCCYEQTQPVFSPPKLYALHLCKRGGEK